MEVDANSSTAARANAMRLQQQQQQQQVNAGNNANANGAGSGAVTGSASGGTGPGQPASDVAAGQRTREATLSQSTAHNDDRGARARELLGSASPTAQRTEPAQPSANGGDPSDVYRDAGMTNPSALSGAAGSPTAATEMSARAPTGPMGRVGRAIDELVRPPTEADHPRPQAPATAGQAVYDAQNPRQAVQNIATQAGLGTLPGRPLTRPQMAVREQHIRESLLSGHEPSQFRGRPVEVTPEERRTLAGTDQEARRRTAGEIARREAQRDSLVAAAGTPERARQLEQAYERATQQERDTMAPQMNRELNAARLAHAGSIITTPLVASRINTARRMLLSNQSVRNAAKAFNRVNRQLGSPFNSIQLPPLPRAPRVRPDA